MPDQDQTTQAKPPLKWTVDPNNPPGPIQRKRAEKILSSLRMEHNTFTEKWGVIGVDEHESTMTEIFGNNCRPDVQGAQEKLHRLFNSTISRSNVNTFIAAGETELLALKANRPLRQDNRKTPEQDAQERAERQARYEKEQAEASARNAAIMAQTESKGTVGTVKMNHALEGVEVHFAGKPPQEVIDKLKWHHFRWARGSRCWYKKQSPNAIRLAYEIAGAKMPDRKPDMGVPPLPEAASVPSVPSVAVS